MAEGFQGRHCRIPDLVRMPHVDQRIGDRLAVCVENPPGENQDGPVGVIGIHVIGERRSVPEEGTFAMGLRKRTASES